MENAMAPARPPETPQDGPLLEPGPLGAALDVLERHREAIEGRLRGLLAGRVGPPYSLMRYHLGWEDSDGRAIEARGGKLLRPALCLLCCEAAGGEWRRALPAAAALELLHNFTLIHDDLEDGSAQRHGRETIWRLWGEAQAINAGDGMFALAHVALLQLSDEGHEPERIVRAARMFDEAALRLCEGQHLDIDRSASDRETYVRMIEGKTAALLAASCGIGALAGGATDATVAALYEFGRRLGLAFQIRDDLLGVWGDPSETGKAHGDDLRAGKRSLPTIVALEHASDEERGVLERSLGTDNIDPALELLASLGARSECEYAAEEHAEAAVAALRPVDLESARKAELEGLARFAAERRA